MERLLCVYARARQPSGTLERFIMRRESFQSRAKRAIKTLLVLIYQARLPISCADTSISLKLPRGATSKTKITRVEC